MKQAPLPIAEPDYGSFIEDLKARVNEARISAARHKGLKDKTGQ